MKKGFVHSFRARHPTLRSCKWARSHQAHTMEMSLCDQQWTQATRCRKFRNMRCLVELWLESSSVHFLIQSIMTSEEQLTFLCLFCSFQAFIWQGFLIRHRKKCLLAAVSFSNVSFTSLVLAFQLTRTRNKHRKRNQFKQYMITLNTSMAHWSYLAKQKYKIC